MCELAWIQSCLFSIKGVRITSIVKTCEFLILVCILIIIMIFKCKCMSKCILHCRWIGMSSGVPWWWPHIKQREHGGQRLSLSAILLASFCCRKPELKHTNIKSVSLINHYSRFTAHGGKIIYLLLLPHLCFWHLVFLKAKLNPAPSYANQVIAGVFTSTSWDGQTARA